MSGIFRHRYIPPPPSQNPFILYSYAADVTAPILSNPDFAEAPGLVMQGFVDTDDSTGTLYWVVTDSATQPSVAQIQAGQDHLGVAADDAGNQAISGLGTQTVAASAVTQNANRYFHFQQRDAGANDSTVVTSAVFQVGPPILSSPTSASNGTGTVTTDEGNGTLYWVVTQSATSPSVAQVQAGNDHLGNPADDSGSQSVSATGIQSVSASGLTEEVTYYFHFQQNDAVNHTSTVVTSASFIYIPDSGITNVLQDIVSNIVQDICRS